VTIMTRKLLLFLVMVAALIVFSRAASAGGWQWQQEPLTPDQELIVRAALGEQAILRMKLVGHVPLPQPIPSPSVSYHQAAPSTVRAPQPAYQADIRPLLPALPTPPIITDRGVAQAPTPRPLPDFPVAKPQPVVKPQPAVQAPPVKTEKGLVQAQTPRPTPDFPVAKPLQEKPAPVSEVKRNKGFLDGKAVVVNQENIHVNVMLSASNNLGRKVAIEVKPGEYVLLRGTINGWEPEQKNTVKEAPRGYEIVKGREVKS